MSNLVTSRFGKQYQGEKAIISLTSWYARICTCGLTIYSILVHCPGFHITLALSEDEFPLKETTLPHDLLLLARSNLIEILWVSRNMKSFKKWIPAASVYPTLPIISADDDCIYLCNYAEKLYEQWMDNKTMCITNNGMPANRFGVAWGRGPNTLYPPCFTTKCTTTHTLNQIEWLAENNYYEDDCFYGIVAEHNNIEYLDLNQPPFYEFHHMAKPLSGKRFDFKNYISILRGLV